MASRAPTEAPFPPATGASLGRFPASRAFVALLVSALVVVLGAPAALSTRALVAGAILAWTAVGAALLHAGVLRGWPRIASAFVLTGDIGAAAAAARLTGGIGAPSLLLVAVPVLAAGLLLQCRAGIVLGLLAGLVSGALATQDASSSGGMLIIIAYHAGVFTALGLGVGLLGRRMAASLREADESRRELREVRLGNDRVLESLSCGVIALDALGRVQSANPAARRLLGLSRACAPSSDDAAAGGSLPLLCGRNPALLEMISSVERGLAVEAERELELTGPEGRIFPAWVKAAPVVDDAGVRHGIVALFWDLTERKRLEEAARRGERLAAIGELSAGLAHEIRNSLKPITGCIELLARRGLLAEAARPMTEVIVREAESLEAFLSQFLALARDKTLKLEEVDLEELIEDEAKAITLGAPGPAPAITIEGTRGLTVRGDPDWLRLVFRNLILNAVEANPAGRVRVEIAASRWHERPSARVRVRDEGPGFGALDFFEALKPFQTGKPAGTGLGLPIALRGVQEHEGRLALESGREGGATLVVELPTKGPGASRARQEAA